MPRYIYFCEKCEQDFTVFHGINDTQNFCVICNSETISKKLTTPIRLNKIVKKTTGDLTKKYIEENKEILEDMKKEIKKNHD